MRSQLAASRPESRSKLRQQAGVTLIELLIAASLLLVVMGAIYGIWSGLERTYSFTNQDIVAQQQARAAMGEMVAVIRTARIPTNPPTEYRNAVISYAGPYNIELWSDVDNQASYAPELVRFRVDPDPQASTSTGLTTFSLVREQGNANTGVFDASTVLVRLVTQNVTNDLSHPLFSYTDTAGNTLPFDATDSNGHHMLSDPTKIREVYITLRVDIRPSAAPQSNVLFSIVQPRNLRQY
ncbi:MAG: prepilin-type N-terminal cleavage/methylation domain-containing protein [Actinobacteria bacterium]|nr:prepilin-type N-terminal cleavage/methylation domain-containing protein [Actinomycetota bacterium]